MVHEMIDGTYRQTNLPNESQKYLAKREELRLAEIELLNTRERVAALRRSLPKGATIQDYEFLEGPASLDDGDAPIKQIKLSDLFTGPDRSLVIYHFMYGKKQANPCPMVPPGSMASMELLITSRKMLTLRLSQRLIRPRYARTLEKEAGPNCVC
jgi:predicted dithiol-disulfide oxidoreductase (DUF899 family)